MLQVESRPLGGVWDMPPQGNFLRLLLVVFGPPEDWRLSGQLWEGEPPLSTNPDNGLCKPVNCLRLLADKVSEYPHSKCPKMLLFYHYAKDSVHIYVH